MPLPRNAEQVAEPPAAYMSGTDFNRPRQARPTGEMPWPAEAGYRLLSDSEKAVLRPLQTTAESHAKQTIKPEDSYYSSKGIYKGQVVYYYPVLILWCSLFNEIRLVGLVAAEPPFELNFERTTNEI